MKKGNYSDSESSGHGPSEDGDSTDTEGPHESDEANEDNSLDDTEYALENEKERLRLEKLPKCLHVGRQVADECNVDVERHNARIFVKTLRNDLIPMVLVLRSNIEVDEALQNFASEYCHSKYPWYQFRIKFNSSRVRVPTENSDTLSETTLQSGSISVIMRISNRFNPSKSTFQFISISFNQFYPSPFRTTFQTYLIFGMTRILITFYLLDRKR